MHPVGELSTPSAMNTRGCKEEDSANIYNQCHTLHNNSCMAAVQLSSQWSNTHIIIVGQKHIHLQLPERPTIPFCSHPKFSRHCKRQQLGVPSAPFDASVYVACHKVSFLCTDLLPSTVQSFSITLSVYTQSSH